MKKLMIAAAIVCAAVVSQAANAYWNFATTAGEAIYDSSYASTFTGTGYIYMLADGITQDDVLSAFRAGNAPSGAFTTVDIVNGVFDKTGVTSDLTGGEQEFFLALVDKQNILLSDSYSFLESEQPRGRDVTFGLQWISEYDEPIMASDVTFADKIANPDYEYGEGWYASSVPEPTSGLLLLLGVAGLALRRRRA